MISEAPRFGRIVVATNFTAGSTAATRRAFLLPLAPRARIDLLHVVPYRWSRKSEGQRLEAAHRDIEVALEAARRLVTPQMDVSLSAHVALGGVSEIARYAQTRDADLVVLGSAAKRRLRGTASELARIGDCPVLIVKTEPARMYQRPLVAMDDDVLSHRLIRLAMAVVDPEVDALGLVTVCSADIDADAAKFELARAEQLAARFVGDEAGIPLRLEPRVRAGAPGQTIIEEADAVGADVIVVGSHLRSRIDRALFGGTGEHVIRNAWCDVLLARPARSLA